MSAGLTVVYDACVLYPAPLRDLLMRLAVTDLYRARWTDLILTFNLTDFPAAPLDRYNLSVLRTDPNGV
jgi:hypothetical protein